MFFKSQDQKHFQGQNSKKTKRPGQLIGTCNYNESALYKDTCYNRGSPKKMYKVWSKWLQDDSTAQTLDTSH